MTHSFPTRRSSDLLTELIPDWKEKGAPLDTAVTEDKFLFLTKEKSLATPSWLLPDCFRNHGNYIVRLGNVARWLANRPSPLGWTSSPDSRQPNCSTPKQARSGAWPPATWGLRATVRTRPNTRPVWTFWHATPYSARQNLW